MEYVPYPKNPNPSNPTNKMVLDKKDLFLDKIFVGDPDNGEHWVWQGDTRKDGYGYFEMNHGDGHTRIQANRASYIIFVDPNLSEDDVILHLCDTRMCVNPNHLFAGPQQENMDDMEAKGRVAEGEDSGRAKMTNEQVHDIRMRYAKGEGLRDLAKEYGIAPSTASYIVNFKTWYGKDVPPKKQ
jgi:hypothetical protein